MYHNEAQDHVQAGPTQCAAAAGAPAAAGPHTREPRNHAPGLGDEPRPALWQGGVPMPTGRVARAVRVPIRGRGGRASRLLYVPSALVGVVRRRVERTGRIDGALAEISAINLELLARQEL